MFIWLICIGNGIFEYQLWFVLVDRLLLSVSLANEQIKFLLTWEFQFAEINFVYIIEKDKNQKGERCLIYSTH